MRLADCFVVRSFGILFGITADFIPQVEVDPGSYTRMRYRCNSYVSVSFAVVGFVAEADSRISRSHTTTGKRDGEDQAASEAEKSGVKIMPDREGDAGNGRD